MPLFLGDIVDPKYLARLHQRWLSKPGMTEQNYYSHGNPLLSSMGKLGRDYLYQLQELGAQEVELFESPLTESRQGCYSTFRTTFCIWMIRQPINCCPMRKSVRYPPMISR
nr:exodeoxyribonuclease V subunit gamma [Aliamphritea spongicola]